VPIVLAVTTVVVYAKVATFDFVLFDDPQYVRNNPRVSGGFSWAGIAWAFTESYAANWHPLTWLSHMLDCELFGVSPGPHHAMSLAIHVAAMLALFVVLARSTGRTWPSAFVAGAFGLHPAHVESVAWIAERKDVLSTLFWALTLGSYARFVHSKSAAWWWASLGLLAAGLMAKPMVVTAPLTLLLFDVWPWRRVELSDAKTLTSRAWPLVREKLPHLALAVLAAAVTVVAQSREGAVAPLGDVPFVTRLATVPVSYATYLVSGAWPVGLASFYPRTAPSVPLALAALLALAAITWLCWMERRARPYLLVGWAWYLVTLFPVSGIVQTGDQLMADRYTYVPFIGIFIAIAWAADDAARAFGTGRSIAVVGGSLLLIWAILASRQVETWRDSFSLARHALAVTQDNHVAHHVLGSALLDAGRTDEAIAEFRAGVSAASGYADLHYALGRALVRRGEPVAALASFQNALQLRPDLWHVRYEYGQALAASGQPVAAIEEYRTAIRLNPDAADVHNSLGLALGSVGQNDAALAEYRAALAIDPGLAAAYNNIGMAQEAQGKKAEAMASYREALRIEPDNAFALTNLGAALGDQGQWAEGAAYLERAIRVGADAPETHYLLGNIRLAEGRREEAIVALRRALALRPGWPVAENKLQQALSTPP
jgi:tetratricopeptide (TPR) repeat protein